MAAFPLQKLLRLLARLLQLFVKDIQGPTQKEEQHFFLSILRGQRLTPTQLLNSSPSTQEDQQVTVKKSRTQSNLEHQGT